MEKKYDFYCPQGRTALLLSGGVDSAVALHLLYQRGVRPDLFYIKIGMEGDDSSCSAEEDVEIAQAIAHRYELPFRVIDLQKEYWDLVVKTYIMERVKNGLTPNSDVMCNKLVKFGAFEEKVGKDYDYLATGHYASLHPDAEGQLWLYAGIDPVKDQTDFLAQLDTLQLQKCIFPLGGMMKSEVRRIAEEEHLPCAFRKDSQGICFLGKIDYNELVRRFLGEKEGPIVDIETGKIVGKHKGYWFHTIGQRKGLGLSGGPWFVVKKNIKKNMLFVAKGYDTTLQYGKEFNLVGFHFLTANPFSEEQPNEVCVKIRHTTQPVPAIMTKTDEGWHVKSERDLQGIAPGQFGVVFDALAERCIGSGEIRN